jgi:uncharacterized membrane protein
MKSRAVIGNHPIHPMLIPFPIAFLTGAVAFDIASRVLSSESLYTTAGHCMIAGIVMGVVAAIPGLIDFTSIIPEDSRAKNKATYHIIVNTVALIAFLVAFLARPPFAARNLITVLPAYMGFLFLSVGGWLGGSLVYEEKVGIDEVFPQRTETIRPPWEEPSPDIGTYPHH